MPENHLQRPEPDDRQDPIQAAHEFISGMPPGSPPPVSPPKAPASPEFARAMREAIETEKGPLAPDWQKCRGMIKGIARQWQDPPKYSVEDAEADGLIGAVKAVNRFDPALGTPFVSYARFRVRSEIQGGKMRAYGLPPSLLTHLETYRKAEAALMLSSGVQPTRAEVVVRSGLAEDRILALDNALALIRAGSLELPDESGASEILDEVERGDPIAGGSRFPDPLEGVLAAASEVAAREQALKGALRYAFARQRNWYDIFMLERVSGLTQKQIAERLGCCRKNVCENSRKIRAQEAEHKHNAGGGHRAMNDQCWRCRLEQRLRELGW